MRQPVLPMDGLLDSLRAGDEKTLEALPTWVKETLTNYRVVYDAQRSALRVSALKAKKRYDLKHDVQLEFTPGDRALLIRGTITDRNAVHPKALLPTEGPFTIERRVEWDRYILTDLHQKRIHARVHVSRLLPLGASASNVHKSCTAHPVQLRKPRPHCCSSVTRWGKAPFWGNSIPSLWGFVAAEAAFLQFSHYVTRTVEP